MPPLPAPPPLLVAPLLVALPPLLVTMGMEAETWEAESLGGSSASALIWCVAKHQYDAQFAIVPIDVDNWTNRQ